MSYCSLAQCSCFSVRICGLYFYYASLKLMNSTPTRRFIIKYDMKKIMQAHTAKNR